MTEIEPDLPGYHRLAWRLLAEGVANRTSPLRLLTLATVSDWGAEARTVVLRAARPEAAELEVHTDAASRKRSELEAQGGCTLLGWHPEAGVQLRMRCRANLADANDSAAAWNAVPAAARRVYGGPVPPGAPIPSPGPRDFDPDPARFCVLRFAIQELDLLHIGESAHHRCLFRRAEGWNGTWRMP